MTGSALYIDEISVKDGVRYAWVGMDGADILSQYRGQQGVEQVKADMAVLRTVLNYLLFKDRD